MNTLEVFALNIQPLQIRKITSTDKHNEAGYQEEKLHFLGWLKDMYERGWRFADQLSAWTNYVLYIDAGIEDEFSDEEPYWMSELRRKLEESVRPANYNEFGGQQ